MYDIYSTLIALLSLVTTIFQIRIFIKVMMLWIREQYSIPTIKMITRLGGFFHEKNLYGAWTAYVVCADYLARGKAAYVIYTDFFGPLEEVDRAVITLRGSSFLLNQNPIDQNLVPSLFSVLLGPDFSTPTSEEPIYQNTDSRLDSYDIFRRAAIITLLVFHYSYQGSHRSLGPKPAPIFP